MHNVSARDVALPAGFSQLSDFSCSVEIPYIVGVHTSFTLNILALQSVNGNFESPLCIILNVANVPSVTISDQAVTRA